MTGTGSSSLIHRQHIMLTVASSPCCVRSSAEALTYALDDPAAALAWLLYVRRQWQRVGLTHKVSDAGSSVAADTPVSLPPMEGEIDPAEFVVCRDARGEEVCLGEGNFGKVRVHAWREARVELAHCFCGICWTPMKRAHSAAVPILDLQQRVRAAR